ncbi:hypothetical protein LTS10_002824 [Elasticomyces elasticus]|nr:hypothetical protein LTS10_002824 [Elasticomyces elasticus]
MLRSGEATEMDISEDDNVILSWICARDMQQKHMEVSNIRAVGTAEWILQDDRFVEWVSGRGQFPVLWCPGLAHTGKTVISSVVIDYLILHHQGPRVGLAYVYCDSEMPAGRTALVLLSSICRQLASQKPELPLQVRKLYKQMTEDEERPGVDDIMLLITSLCDSFETVFICVDGLTECDANGERPILISKLRWMHNHSARVLLQRLEGDAKSEGLFAELKMTKRALINKIVSGCGGMYLMAQLKLDKELRHLREMADQKESKEEPSTLLGCATKNQSKIAVWREGIRIIRKQRPFRRDLALRTLSLALHLKEPLHIFEFGQALSIDAGFRLPFIMSRADMRVQEDENVGQAAWESATSLTEICEGLITFHEDSKVNLSGDCMPDPSTEDLKELVPDPQLRIARACLMMLCKPECLASDQRERVESEEETTQSQWLVPFKRYAKQYWVSHYEACTDEALDDLVVKYFCMVYEHPAQWVEERVGFFQPSSYVVVEDDETPLLKASRLGMNRVLEKLLAMEKYDVHAESWNRESASSVAVAAGHISIVQLLYKHGAILANYRNICGDTLLHMVAKQNDDILVALLIWFGLNPNTRSAGRRPVLPIEVAAANKSAEALDMLLQYGAELTDAVMRSAAQSGDVETLKVLVKRGRRLSAPTGSGEPPLHAAVKSGSLPLVDYMIANGVDIFELDDRRTSAIHHAASNGHLDIANLLLRHGADPFAMDDGPNHVCDGCTPFDNAMWHKHQELVERLSPLLHSGIPNQTLLTMMRSAISAKLTEVARQLLGLVTGELVYKSKRGPESLLSTAVFEGDEEMVKLLLERGGSVLFLDKDGRGPLHVAANGHESATKILLKYGADPNLQDNLGYAPLHEAANGNPRITKMLLGRGANPDLQTQARVAPLHVAACSGDVETLHIILESDLDIAIQAEDGSTALVAASCASKSDAVRLLLQYGAPTNIQNLDGETALHHAIVDNDVNLVQDLLRHGIDTSIPSRRGGSALHLAAFRGHAAIVSQLLAYGADIELGHDYEGDGYFPKDDDVDEPVAHLSWNQARTYRMDRPHHWSHIESQWRPIHSAVCGGHRNVVEMLFQHGADISSRGSKGELPLHVAASAGKPEIIILLISNGATISEKDNNGRTALHTVALASVAVAIDEADKHLLCNCELAKFHAEKSQDHSKVDCVAVLLDNGSDPTSENHEGLTPLALAVRAGHDDVVEALIGRKVSCLFSTEAYVKLLGACAARGTAKSLEVVSNAFTETSESLLAWNVILNNAIVAGDHEMVVLAVRKGARPTRRTTDGENPLHRAIKDRKVKIVDSLLGAGADFLALDDSGRNALHVACSHPGLKTLTIDHQSNDKNMIASYLLQDGVPVNARTPEGNTALHFAVTTGDIGLVRTLLNSRASVNIRNKRYTTPLHAAVSTWVFPAIVELLIARGACPTAQDDVGRTPLHLIRWTGEGDGAVADYLLKHGADHSIHTRNGDMATHCAIRRGNWPLFRRLVDAGASVNAQGAKGRTVLHIAVKRGLSTLIEPLVKLDADVHAVDKGGWTPLHHAAHRNQLEVLGLLLKHRSPPRKSQRRTKAVTIASVLTNNGADVKKLLSDAGINIHGGSESGGEFYLQPSMDETKFENAMA